MVTRHHYTFFDFDFTALKTKFLKQFLEHFIKHPATVGQNIQISYNLMEFNDGIYIISSDTFIRRKK